MPVSSPPWESTDMADQTQTTTDQQQELTDKQREDLQNDELQAKYQAAYEQQMRRQSCPGCGETGVM